MNSALCKVAGKWHVLTIEDDILSSRIDVSDISEMRCDCCNAPASIVRPDIRIWHFKAKHEPWCDKVNDGHKHKAFKVTTDTIIDDLDTIFSHRDHATQIKKSPKPPIPGPNVTPPIPHPDIDDIDTITIYDTKKIRSVGGIYSYILENGPDANICKGICGGDKLLGVRKLREVRKKGMSGMYIAVTKRFSLKNLDYPLFVPKGYTCLIDNFSSKIDNAIFFLVRLERNDQNDLFRAKIIGNNPELAEKSKRSNILILGNWREYENDYYDVYISDDINTRCYSFVDYKEPKYV